MLLGLERLPQYRELYGDSLCFDFRNIRIRLLARFCNHRRRYTARIGSRWLLDTLVRDRKNLMEPLEIASPSLRSTGGYRFAKPLFFGLEVDDEGLLGTVVD